MKLKYAAPMDLVASSLYGAWIVSPKALDAAAADDTYFEKGIDAGTGPYTIESYTADKEVLMTAYADYWGGWDEHALRQGADVSIMPEAAVQQQVLDGGEVDIAFSVPLENIASLQGQPRLHRSSTSPRSSTTSASSTPDKQAVRRSARSARRCRTRSPTTTSSPSAPRATGPSRTDPCRPASSPTTPTCRSTTRTSRRPRRC